MSLPQPSSEQDQHAVLRAVMAFGARGSPGPAGAAAATSGTTTTSAGGGGAGGGSAPTTLDAGSLHPFPGLDWGMLTSADHTGAPRAPGDAQPDSGGALLPSMRLLANSTPSTGGSVTQGFTGIANLQEAIAGLNAMTLAPAQQHQQQGSPSHHQLVGAAMPHAASGHMLSQEIPMWELLDGAPPSHAAAGPSLGGSGILGAGATTTLVMAATTAADSASLYVSGLPPDATELLMYQTFAPHGALQSCKVKIDPTTGLCSGVAFVNYLHKDDAQRAMRLLDRSTLPGGRQLHITLQAPRKVRAAAAASKAAVATMQRHQQLQQQQQPMAMLMGVQPTAALPLQHQQQQQHLLSWEQQQQQQLRNMMMGVQTVAVAAPQPQPQPQAGPSASAWILSQQGGGDVVGAGMPPTGYW